MLQRTVPRSLDQVTKRGFAHGSPPKAGGSYWDLEMKARKASRRDWLVLTHHQTGQEEEEEEGGSGGEGRAYRQANGTDNKKWGRVVLIKGTHFAYLHTQSNLSTLLKTV